MRSTCDRSAAGRFVARLAAAGVAVDLDRGRVRITPAGRLDDHDRTVAVKYRAALARHLAAPDDSMPVCVVCGAEADQQAPDPDGRRYCTACEHDYLTDSPEVHR